MDAATDKYSHGWHKHILRREWLRREDVLECAHVPDHKQLVKMISFHKGT